MRSAQLLLFAALIAVICAHANHLSHEHDEEHGLNHELSLPRVAFTLRDFQLNEVSLSPGSPVYDGQQMNAKYLNLLDAERLLYNFKVTAKLPTSAQPLGGWESPTTELRGHFVGMYLSASAKAYRSYGDVAQKMKADYIVTELGKCQTALGGGYISAFPTELFDRLEALQAVWAPYYTIHKILQGLYDMHVLTGNKVALEIVSNMASWIAGRIRNVVARDAIYRWQQILNVEFGGMNDIMYLVYNETRNPEHLYVAQMFDMGAFLGPLALNQDLLTLLHVNQHIPIVLGASSRYEIIGDPTYRTIAENFWGIVYNSHTYATGGTSGGNGTDEAWDEHWGDPGKLANTLTNNNQETCTTYNMLKLLKHLIQWSADVKYFDHFERAYFNGILGTQNLASVPGTYIYNYPLATGFSKATSLAGWGNQFDSFWCCYGSSVIQWAKMGEAIYFRSNDDSSLYINLFVASVLRWSSKGITVTQTTTFPSQQGSKFTINIANGAPTAFAVNIRVPYWVAAGAQVTVNGQKQTVQITPASFVTLSRTWKTNDTFTIDLPFNFHAAPTPDNPKQIAVMYGPLVMGGLTTSKQLLTLPISNSNQLSSIITSAGSPLKFNMKVVGGTIPLVPLYTLTDETYGVYWYTQ